MNVATQKITSIFLQIQIIGGCTQFVTAILGDNVRVSMYPTNALKNTPDNRAAAADALKANKHKEVSQGTFVI